MVVPLIRADIYQASTNIRPRLVVIIQHQQGARAQNGSVTHINGRRAGSDMIIGSPVSGV